MIKTNAQCAVIASCLLVMSQLATASSSDSATLTVGGDSSKCEGGGVASFVLTGYVGPHMGSYSPTALTGGESVIGLYDITSYGCGSSYRSTLGISGFSSAPGKDWLISVTCNGIELTGAGSAAYSYGDGQAGWDWNTPFGFKSGSYSCTIVHD